MTFSPSAYALLVIVGIAGGFLNVMAGGGSMFTMPALIFLGAPAAMANGTSRVALVFQNAAAIARFARGGFSEWRLALTLSAASLPGAIAGAFAAVKIDGALWQRVFAVVMVAVVFATVKKPSTVSRSLPAHGWLWAHAGMLLVGFYGGFLQVGVGFLIMALLRHTVSRDLVSVNAHKVILVGIYTVPSLLVFAFAGTVHVWAGLALSVGSVAGATAAAHVQLSRGEGPIRVVTIVAVMLMAIKLFWG